MKKSKPLNNKNASVWQLLHFLYPHSIFFALAYIVILDTFNTPIFSFPSNITSSQTIGVFLFQSAYIVFLSAIILFFYYGCSKLNKPQALIKLNKQFLKIFLICDILLIALYYQIAPSFFF